MRPTLLMLVAAMLLIPPGMCRCQLVGAPAEAPVAEAPKAKCKCEGCRDRQAQPPAGVSEPLPADSPDCPALRDGDASPAPVDPPLCVDLDLPALGALEPTPAHPRSPTPSAAPAVPWRLVLHKFQI